MSIKVSIIIPVYGAEKYITECVESVKQQSYENVECILINDYTFDNSIKKVEECLRDYVGPIQFKIYHNEKNIGLSLTRNKGVDIAQGEYIFFLDSDDYIYPNSIELLAKSVSDHHEVDLVIGDLKREIITGDKSLNISSDNKPNYSDSKSWLYNNFLINTPVVACNKLLRREFIVSNKLYFEANLIHEDVIWHFFVSKYVSSVAFCFNYTYFNRKNVESLTSSLNRSNQRFNSSLILIHKCMNNISFHRKSMEILYILKFLRNLKIKFLTSSPNEDLNTKYKKLLTDFNNSKHVSILFAPFIYMLRYSDLKNVVSNFVWNRGLGVAYRLMKHNN